MRRNLEKEKEWRSHIQDWESGDVTIRYYCECHGLSEASFHYWRREIAQRNLQTKEMPLAQEYPSGSLNIDSSFAEIKIIEADASQCGIELALPCGYRVILGPGFDESALRRLLSVLSETASC